ncbi:hypothetical protein [Ferrovibrio terrae]|uniref:hypothetical protein n=1 Tax=Ferrovibrio terrae TaxID=2594003 RepID=UPI003138375A
MASKKKQNTPASKPVAPKAPKPKADPKPMVEQAVGDKAVRFKHRSITFIRAAVPVKG